MGQITKEMEENMIENLCFYCGTKVIWDSDRDLGDSLAAEATRW